MNRIGFLNSFLAKGLLLTLPFISKAAKKNLIEVLIYKQLVAGFQYSDGLKVIDKMKAGDELHLVREPDNIHDDRAIAIYWKQHKIGYVPAINNEIPNNFLLNGLALKARIEKLNKKADPWLMCEAGIYLLYPKDLLQKNTAEATNSN